MKHLYATAALVALFCIAWVSPARSTTVIEQSLSDLCDQADMIFVGKVVSTEPHWRDESQKSIDTTVTFAVLDPIFGVDSHDVSLELAGGEMDNLREVVAGMPQFQTGEEVMIFATRKANQVSPIIGFHQGCFRLTEDGGRRVVLNAESQPLTGLSKRSLSYGKREDGPGSAMPLDQFLESVNKELERRR